MKQSNEFFATARPWRLFLTVALPGMVSMLAASVYNVMEGIFIGNYLGEAAFAAVSVGFPLVMINFSLADLVGVGSSVPISISLGRQDRDRANNYFTCSFILIVLAALLLGALLFFGSPLLVRLMGAEGELARLAVKYVRVYALMGPITTITFALDNYLRISGFVKGSMWLNVLMSGLTIVLLYLFLGVLGWDVAGSAFATCVAMAVCVCIGFIPFLRGKSVLRFVRPRFQYGMVREIIQCGSPTFLNNIAGRVAAIAINSVLLSLGGQTAIAACSVLMYSATIIEPMLYGMSDAASPALGYNWGAKSLSRVKSIAQCSFVACGLLGVAGAAVMYWGAEPIARLFVGAGDTALLSLTVEAMRIFCFAFLFRWFVFASQSFFSAIGKPLQASVISVCNAMVFPLLYIFLFRSWGVNGMWFHFVATSCSVAILAVVLLRFAQRRMQYDIEHSRH